MVEPRFREPAYGPKVLEPVSSSRLIALLMRLGVPSGRVAERAILAVCALLFLAAGFILWLGLSGERPTSAIPTEDFHPEASPANHI